jgi:hypothetical protein
VKEETGLNIKEEDFSQLIKIKQIAVYFYIQKECCDINVQTHIENNDANALGWLSVDCIEDMITEGIISLNNHCKYVFKHVLNKIFKDSTYTFV